jgi:hypothetical protein
MFLVENLTVVLVAAGIIAVLAGAAASWTGLAGRRRERRALPARGVVRSVLYTNQGTSVRLGLAWDAPDGSGTREGVWHGGGGPGRGFQVGQQVPLRVGRHDDWVQVATAPRQGVVDGCGGVAFLVVGLLLLVAAAASSVLT